MRANMQAITGCYSTRALWVRAALSVFFSVAFPLFAQSGTSSSIPKNAVAEIPTSSSGWQFTRKCGPVAWRSLPVAWSRGACWKAMMARGGYRARAITAGPFRDLSPSRRSPGSGRLRWCWWSPPWSADEFRSLSRLSARILILFQVFERAAKGKPVLLKLRDLNGDGIATETAFFEAESCMGLPTTLIGFSVAQDKVIQYPAEIEETDF